VYTFDTLCGTMNIKLSGFGHSTHLCIKKYVYDICANIWCEIVEDVVKLTWSSSILCSQYVYEYHITNDAFCFCPKLRQRNSTAESIYIDRIVSLLLQLKDKNDYDIFYHCAKESGILLHKSVFQLIDIIRRKQNLKLKQCKCSPKRKENFPDERTYVKRKLDF
jgi:hypothetical protein